MPRVGLISDTHGFLDPQVAEQFAGVDHILHAGDVGRTDLVWELEQIAPVTAVTGNTDSDLPFRETEVLTVSGRTFLVQHIVNPRHIPVGLVQRIRGENAQVVVFGHTHESYCETIDGVLFVNPGSAGRSRFGKPRTLGILSWEPSRPDFQFRLVELGS